MKRIIGILLSISILFSMSVFAESSGTAAEYAEEFAIFEYLGVYSASENAEELEKHISRSDFVNIAARTIGATESATNVYYADVPRENANVASINAFREMGFLSNSEQFFRPDEAITYAEAAKIVLSIAGYDVYANAMGGFPSGYMTAASRLNILPNCADSTALTYTEALTMIYNVFSTGIYDIKTISGDVDLTYETASETVFSIYRNIYIDEGTVTAEVIASANGSTAGENEVIIDGEKYNIDENIYIDGQFLNYIKFFYEKQNNDTKYIFYTQNSERGSNKDDLIISSEDLRSFDSSSYIISYYSKNEKLQTRGFSRSALVYYNGSEYTDSVSAAFDEFINGNKRGSIRLKDINADGTYDAVIIKSYRNFVVNMIDDVNGVYYNMADHSDSIKISDYTGLSVKNANLQKAALTIATPSVFSVAESKDKQFIEIIICGDRVEGTVKLVQKNTDYTEVTIGERTFKVDSAYSAAFPEFVSGADYSVILDTYGYAAYAEAKVKDDYKIGLLTDCVSNTDGFSRSVKFKIYENGSGGVKVFECADTVKIDGKKYDISENDPFYAIPGSDSANVSGGAKIEQQAIRYKLNDADEVCEVDTYTVGENEDADNTLTKVKGPFGFNRYYNRNIRLGTSVLRDQSKTVMFAKPRTDKNGYLLSYDIASGQNYPEDSYVLDADGNKILTDDTMFRNEYFIPIEQWARLDVYNFDSNTSYADILVYTYEPYLLSADCFLYDSYGEMLNSNGESVPMIVCYNGAKQVTYALLSTEVEKVKTLKRGDLFRCSINDRTGEMRSIQRVYDSSADVFYDESGNPRQYTETGTALKTIKPDYWYSGQISIQTSTNKVTSFDFYRNFQLTKGRVINRIGKALYIDWDGTYDSYEEAVDFNNCQLVIIDTKTDSEKSIYSARPEQVADYRSTGSDSAQIVVHNTWLTPKCGYVYIR